VGVRRLLPTAPRPALLVQLVLLLLSFVIAGFALVGWTQRPRDLVGVLIWFGAAIVAHDLVLLPAYTLLDHLSLRRLPPRAAPHVRVPALISAFVLVVQFPTILGFGARRFHGASGLTEHGYLLRWLLMSAALFLLSGAAYVVRRQQAAHVARRPQGPADTPGDL
jgi:hypothetical protein